MKNKATVLYDFEAQLEEEVSVKEGDEIEVLEICDDGWSVCQLGLKTGIVPSNYYQFHREKNEDLELENESYQVRKIKVSDDLEKYWQQQEMQAEVQDEQQSDVDQEEERRARDRKMKLQRLSVVYTGGVSDRHPLLVRPFWKKNASSIICQVSHGGRYIFGVSKYGQVYRFNAEIWNKEPGNLMYVSSSKDGSIWGVTSSHLVLRLKGNQWEQMPGKLIQIHVASKEHIVGVNRHHYIYKYDTENNQWKRLPGTARHVSIGTDGDMWCCGTDHKVYHFNDETQEWDRMPGLLTKVHVGKNKYHVIGLNRHGFLYQWIDDMWYRVDNKVYKDVSVWRLGKHMAAVGLDDTVYFHLEGRS